jgi:hypothetical protein
VTRLAGLIRGLLHRGGSAVMIFAAALVAVAATGPAYYAAARTSILHDTVADARPAEQRGNPYKWRHPRVVAIGEPGNGGPRPRAMQRPARRSPSPHASCDLTGVVISYPGYGGATVPRGSGGVGTSSGSPWRSIPAPWT